MPHLLLGLIGDNIAASRAPALHELAGRLSGLEVRYDRLVPRELGLDFDGVFSACGEEGRRGVNVTYPYKERAAARVRIDDAAVRRLGAVNTVLFEPDGPRGYNTDYTGFLAAYRDARGMARPGPVCLAGAGGVGKAVAFGLVSLGLSELRIVERDIPKAELLAEALLAVSPRIDVMITTDPAKAAPGAAGFVNCTPIGMVGYPGTPLMRPLLTGGEWAFDAVYTPRDTQFLRDAAAEGLHVISGYELFFHQGVAAWSIFSGGRRVDPEALRAGLASLAAA